MKPYNLKTKIFLDSSSIAETQEIQTKLGWLDGQTTNPSNFVKALKQETGKVDLKFNRVELYRLYKERIQEISGLLPGASISVEVYADLETSAEEMVIQGKEMYNWISNAHVKLPVTHEGLKAAEILIKEGIKVNLTLVFNQEQAAAVYAATKGARRGDVFISPFVGRYYDKKINGMDLIKNILKMYEHGDGHVEVLAASIRNGEQLSEVIANKSDIVTCYSKAIIEWFEMGKPVKKPENFSHPELASIEYEEIDLNKPWSEFSVQHEMTDSGLASFVKDWNGIIN